MDRTQATHRMPPLWAVIVVFAPGFVLMDRSAAWLGSLRGEYGAAVCAMVLIFLLASERLLTGRQTLPATRALGLALPSGPALLWTCVLCGALLLFYPIYGAISGASMAIRPDAALLVPGLLLQGGVAEEALFRGFLFRHIRARHSFWRAAALSALPFTAVHLLLFALMPWPVALVAVTIALVLSFPLAWLFERSGGSIWPPALLHFTVQGSIKLVDGTVAPDMAIAWMALSAAAPWLVFLLRAPKPDGSASPPR